MICPRMFGALRPRSHGLLPIAVAYRTGNDMAGAA